MLVLGFCDQIAGLKLSTLEVSPPSHSIFALYPTEADEKTKITWFGDDEYHLMMVNLIIKLSMMVITNW